MPHSFCSCMFHVLVCTCRVRRIGQRAGGGSAAAGLFQLRRGTVSGGSPPAGQTSCQRANSGSRRQQRRLWRPGSPSLLTSYLLLLVLLGCGAFAPNYSPRISRSGATAACKQRREDEWAPFAAVGSAVWALLQQRVCALAEPLVALIRTSAAVAETAATTATSFSSTTRTFDAGG